MLRLSCVLLLCLVWASAAAAQSLPDELARVDRLWKQGEYSAALAVLEDLQDRQPADAEVQWRLARTRAIIGERIASEEERGQLYEAALEAAQEAVRLDPESAQAHLALAIAAGRKALFASSTRQKVEFSRMVKEHADRAIALDPDLAMAYYVRGRWYKEVSDLDFFERAAARLAYGGLPDASYERAVADLRRAVELEDRVRYRLALVRTYHRMGEEDQARTELQHLLELPETYPEDADLKAEARELLQEL